MLVLDNRNVCFQESVFFFPFIVLNGLKFHGKCVKCLINCLILNY
jgi:hypothetical protein